jgi:hypothetical protein
MLLRHPCGHASAPVSALRDIAGIAQSLHELRPRLGDLREAPPALGGVVGKAVPGKRRRDDVESVLGLATVRRRVGQRPQNFEEFHHRSRPPVSHDDRQRVRFFRPRVEEMNSEAVDLRAELRHGVQALLEAAHVVTGSPVVDERLHLRQGHALGPVADGLLARPADHGKPRFQVVKRAVWDGQLELGGRVRRRRQHDLRGLRGRCLVLRRGSRQTESAEPSGGEQHAATRSCFLHWSLSFVQGDGVDPERKGQ